MLDNAKQKTPKDKPQTFHKFSAMSSERDVAFAKDLFKRFNKFNMF